MLSAMSQRPLKHVIGCFGAESKEPACLVIITSVQGETRREGEVIGASIYL